MSQAHSGSSPASRGGTGVYIEGELGAFYLLVLLAGAEPRGLPGAVLSSVSFQGEDKGYALDDVILRGDNIAGPCVLEIQSKRTIKFSPKDRVFQEVCEQISRSKSELIDPENHILAVATQRTSHAISGAYQDVLKWAKADSNERDFFKRLAADGVANPDMRTFAETFRSNLVSVGVENNDAVIWSILRRFLILEFDFEASAPVSRSFALLLARSVLAPEDLKRSEALVSVLIERSIATGTVGGSLDKEAITQEIVQRGFKLVGDQNIRQPREMLGEATRLSLAGISNSVGGTTLPRVELVSAIDDALTHHRFVEICGPSGVGKSGLLRDIAERQLRESTLIFLDPITTPGGGWGAFAQMLGTTATASSFLSDIAISGGGTLFIDNLEMFSDVRQQRTVVDLLRVVSGIDGFSVVITSRSDFMQGGDRWLPKDVVEKFEPVAVVEVSELNEAEISTLIEQSPDLRSLLQPDHPAAHITRNLQRLSQLIKVKNKAEIRTEAALARHWWESADGADASDVRAAQRLMSGVAKAELVGSSSLEVQEDSSARAHLMKSLTFREARRDHVAFHHDVLRDWAIAIYFDEDYARFTKLDLTVPVSPRVARGIEFSGRFALEFEDDKSRWLDLLSKLDSDGADSSWRRCALVAIARSEIAPELLECCTESLILSNAELLQELCTSVYALETKATVDIVEDDSLAALPRSLRTASTLSSLHVLNWCVQNADAIPLLAIAKILKVVEANNLIFGSMPTYAASIANMLFEWLMQLDVPGATRTIPHDDRGASFDDSGHRRMVNSLRMHSLLLAEHAKEPVKAYLIAISIENDDRKINEVRLFGRTLASTAPEELSALIENNLLGTKKKSVTHDRELRCAFGRADSNYLPASPAQAPFLDLLEIAPAEGQSLIRKLVSNSVAFHSENQSWEAGGFDLQLVSGSRHFPWNQTYYWSRSNAHEYSLASGLKALEAWGHSRLDAGESVDIVLADVLGPDESCASFLMIGIDLLLSHWPASREALVPFVSSPELLARDRERAAPFTRDFVFGQEPHGKVQLADLANRSSRNIALEKILPYYLADEPIGNEVRARLQEAVQRLGDYEEDAGFFDPEFMGRYALNILNRENWSDLGDGNIGYNQPSDEVNHLKKLKERHGEIFGNGELEASISLAVENRDRSSNALASKAVEYANGELPEEDQEGLLREKSTRLISTALLVVRDGDEQLLLSSENWARDVISLTIAKESHNQQLTDSTMFNRFSIALSALGHLWMRNQDVSDRNGFIHSLADSGSSGAVAFEHLMPELLENEPKLLKSVLRASLVSCHWRQHQWEESPHEQEDYLDWSSVMAHRAVIGEIDWLNGGLEPQWPVLAQERVATNRRSRIAPTSTDSLSTANNTDTKANVTRNPDRWELRPNSQQAARWLRLLSSTPGDFLGWRGEFVDTYANWSARLNGLGLATDSDGWNRNTEWNASFYSIVAVELLEADTGRFNRLLADISGLPDSAFCDVVETLIRSADVAYFNSSTYEPARSIELRSRLIDRALSVKNMRNGRNTGDLSIGFDIGGLVSKLLMNDFDPYGSTTSYLVTSVFDRLDPLLDTWRPLLMHGPSNFVAYCVMNVLLVSPKAAHIEFMLDSVEIWLNRTRDNSAIWIQGGMGGKVMQWFDQVDSEAPECFRRGSAHSSRIDSVLSELTALGVPEAHDLAARLASRS